MNTGMASGRSGRTVWWKRWAADGWAGRVGRREADGKWRPGRVVADGERRAHRVVAAGGRRQAAGGRRRAHWRYG
ncbi:hypothetical protein [Streptomyces californicus]|uniref:hypothetical protein n=1 Tax=Streptomyces californicus TaxID=67351 RepID=UPI0012FF43D2|nr:hypothetical protein [Streptomyces californicus]QRV55565.1 hypothetical protein I6J40_16100 [Streptomyces californicus]